MALAPQFRLRTFFLVFFCAAVGLTVGTRWDPQQPQWSPALGRYSLSLDWHYACLAAASVAIVIGLSQEVLRLRAPSFRDLCDIDARRFSLSFSIAWRLVCAGVIILCLIATLLFASQIVEMPDRETPFTYDFFPYIVWACCIIAVLLASLTRWRPIERKRELTTWHILTGILAALVLLSFILPELGLAQHLVHVATNSIENRQPAAYHRPGEFPDHRAEGFRLFWISLLASGSIFLAAACLIVSNSSGFKQGGVQAICSIVFLVAAALSAAYCVWYFTTEFHRVSPYMADAGFVSNWLERIVGAVFALLFVAAGAYRLTLRDGPSDTVVVQPADEDNSPIIYESALCLLVLFIAVTIYVFEAVRIYSNASYWFAVSNNVFRYVGTLASLCHDPASLLMILIGVASIQLGWWRWRRRKERVEWRIGLLDRRPFTWNVAALGILLVVGIPTLSSFCFVCWLGPWYFYGD
jgi:hypothetical protein